MKKIFTFAVALLASLSMMAQTTFTGTELKTNPTTKDGVTVTLAANISVSNQQIWKDGSTGVKADVMQVGNSANQNFDVYYVEIASSTTISAVRLKAAHNQSGATTTYDFPVVSWAGETAAAEFDAVSVLTAPGKEATVEPGFLNVPLCEDAHVVRIYRTIRVNADQNAFASSNYTTLGDGKTIYIAEIEVETGAAPTNVATLKNIKVDGESIEDFDPALLSYDMELPYGTTVVPTVTATPTLSNETVEITPATTLPGITDINVVSADGTVSTHYSIEFYVSTEASDDATLKSLKIDGTAVAKFKADSIDYAYAVPAVQTALPVVAAEANEEHASVVINQATEVPGTATVVVTAQDGTTTITYTIAFTRAEALKDVNELIMSNSYMAWWSEGDATKALHAYYLQGEAEPTVTSVVVSEGATYVVEEGKVKVTGADATVAEYDLVIEAVAPLTFTEDTIVFDGTESYIKGGYGFDSSKKWRFSKTDADYTRERTGKTHIELFLPACASVSFLESCGQTRDIRLYINGVEFGDKTKQVKNGWSKFDVAQEDPFMLSIVSAQTGGDGGIAKMVMTAFVPTSINNVEAAKAIKVIENGQIVIIKNGVRYNAVGAKL